MTRHQRKTAFYTALQLGKIALNKRNFTMAFYHFENAHILGQRHVYRHTLSHFWMLLYGFRVKNYREIFGQLLRILAAILITIFWVPKGNTGGANISPVQPLPIRKELQKYFSE